MITFFACPKPFRGHLNIIQRNAIKSWTLLNPKPEIILMGNDEGVAEICEELGLVHIAEIDRNEYGTPLVNSIFQIAQERASHPIVCYINSDIILMSDFMRAVQIVMTKMPKFLALGQRTDIDIIEALDFEAADWEGRLKNLLNQKGVLHPANGIDFFCFPRGMYADVPPFAIGRMAWDNWLVWRAWADTASIVDVTQAVTIGHQNHNYDPTKIKTIGPRLTKKRKSGVQREVIIDGKIVELGPEAIQNRALVPDEKNLNIWAAEWMLDSRLNIKKRILSPSLPYLLYQIKMVLPLHWPAIRPMIRWIMKVSTAR